MQTRNQALFLLARLVPSVIGVATTAILTRLLEPSVYGLYALALSVMFFITMGVFEWLGLSLMRMAPGAAQPDRFFGTVMSCYSLLLGLCTLAWGVIFLITPIRRYPGLGITCLGITFVAAWFELRQRLQLAELSSRSYITLSICRALFSSVLVCSAAYVYQSAVLMLLGLAVGILVPCLLVPEPRLGFLRLRFDSRECWRLLQFGFPLSISVGLATILFSLDKWMLQAFWGAGVVGLFTAATLVSQTPILALAGGLGPSSFSTAVQALEFESRQAARTTLARHLIILLAVIIPGAAGIIVLSEDLAHLMVGAAYWHSVVLLAPWLSAAAVMASVRAFYLDYAFQLAKQTLPLVWTTLAIVVVNLVLDIWLIPLIGQLGAAIGSCAALLGGLILTAIAGRNAFPLPFPAVEVIKVIASTAFMVSILHVLPRNVGNLMLLFNILIGMLSYGVGLAAFDVLGVRSSFIRACLAHGEGLG